MTSMNTSLHSVGVREVKTAVVLAVHCMPSTDSLREELAEFSGVHSIIATGRGNHRELPQDDYWFPDNIQMLLECQFRSAIRRGIRLSAWW